MALKWAFIGHAFHSLHSNYARGVSVLMSKCLSCTPKTIVTDLFGRFIVLVLLINNLLNSFVVVYVPPPFSLAAWELVLAKVLQVAEGPIILAGDLNTVLSLDMDRLHFKSNCSSPLEACITQYGLVEAWRWKNPDTHAFFCYSSTYNTLSTRYVLYVQGHFA